MVLVVYKATFEDVTGRKGIPFRQTDPLLTKGKNYRHELPRVLYSAQVCEYVHRENGISASRCTIQLSWKPRLGWKT